MEESEEVEGVSSAELLKFTIHDTISAPPNPNPYEPRYRTISSSSSSLDDPINVPLVINNNSFMFDHHHGIIGTMKLHPHNIDDDDEQCLVRSQSVINEGAGRNLKKRKRRGRACKNKEEAEVQRMTHINVERNRRKLMNEHLSVLRSLMPESYVQRGDQASIVGGAIEFVKELEHLLQSLEAKKLQLNSIQHQQEGCYNEEDNTSIKTRSIIRSINNNNVDDDDDDDDVEAPFAQFFTYPQYRWCQAPNKYTSNTRWCDEGVADVEVRLIETHASLRILFRRCLLTTQLSHLVAGFHALRLSILHLNLTSAHPLVLYNINAKVEEGCHVTSVDDIAAAVHNMLRLIEQEAAATATALC